MSFIRKFCLGLALSDTRKLCDSNAKTTEQNSSNLFLVNWRKHSNNKVTLNPTSNQLVGGSTYQRAEPSWGAGKPPVIGGFFVLGTRGILAF